RAFHVGTPFDPFLLERPKGALCPKACPQPMAPFSGDDNLSIDALASLNGSLARHTAAPGSFSRSHTLTLVLRPNHPAMLTTSRPVKPRAMPRQALRITAQQTALLDSVTCTCKEMMDSRRADLVFHPPRLHSV
ncbi:hypothetical protein IAQ61_008680, partial [Plenodomus lingam]|uniref:uncharacterized protein n=1 Tax=Leptosphaeria maculans TaxID=5022 RepID=UPI003331D0FE